MASRTLTVVAKVKDAASAPLKKVKEGFDSTGKSIKNTGINLTEFNRIMFSTTAFVGFFTRAFGALGNSLTMAGDLDRLTGQFERVVGPKGQLFQQIKGMTKNTIDRMEAMRAGIALKSSGVVKDVRSIAEIVARAGTAAKRAGLNSAEGIKHVTEFMKDGKISGLSFHNVLSPTNVALQMQMAILQKAGGVMGHVLSTQAKLRIGMAALRAATQGMENDSRDLSDVLQSMAQSFTFLKGTAGAFLGKALIPIFDKVSETVDTITDFIDRVQATDKTMLQAIKNIVIVTGAFTTLLATVGSARLIFKALGALGVGGIPFLAFSLLGLASAFTDTEKAIEPFVNVLKQAGAVMMGTFQLISSFLMDGDNFAKGIGKMDSQLAAFLQKNGLLELTKNIARVSSIVIKFVQDAGNQLIKWFKDFSTFVTPAIKVLSDFLGTSDPNGWSRSWLGSGDKVTSSINKVADASKQLDMKDKTKNLDKNLAKNKKSVMDWATSWVGEGTSVRDVLIKITAAAAGLYAAFKLLSFGKGFLSKIPIIGKFFGGGKGIGGGPDGSARDPLHVQIVKGITGAFGIDRLIEILKNPTSIFRPTTVATGAATAATTVATAAQGVGSGVATAAAAGLGGSLLFQVAKWTGAIGLAAIAGFALGKTIMYIDGLLGGNLASMIDKLIDAVAGFLRIPGSSSMQKEQETLMKTKEYQAVVAMMLKAGKQVTVEGATALTKVVLANAASLAKQKQLEMNQAGVFGKATAALGFLDISPEAEAFGSQEALDRMADSAIFKRPGDIIGGFATQMPDDKKRTEFLMSKKDAEGNVIAPAMPTTPQGQDTVLSMLMEGLEAKQRAQVEAAMSAAVAGTSAGGKEITPEEWQAIFTAAMDQSQVTKHTKQTADKKDPTNLAKTRC